jgi:hypothetical protein
LTCNIINARSVAINQTDNTICVLYSSGDAVNIYSAGGALFAVTAAGVTSDILVKYTSAGVGVWFTSATETDSADVNLAGLAIKSDDGSIYVCSQYVVTGITFKNSDGSTGPTLTGGSGENSYVAKYSAAGFISWAANLKANGIVTASNISVNTIDGRICVTGVYTGNLQIVNGDSTVYGTLPITGSSNAYVINFSNTGIVQWATRITSNTSGGTGISINPITGNIYANGYYSNTVSTVYNANGTPFGNLLAGPGYNAYVVAYSSAGNVIFTTVVQSGAGTNNTVVDPQTGNLCCVGSYNGVATVYNSDGSVFNTLPSATNGTYLIKYTTSQLINYVLNLPNSANQGFSKIIVAENPCKITASMKYLGSSYSSAVLAKDAVLSLLFVGNSWKIVSNNGASLS